MNRCLGIVCATLLILGSTESRSYRREVSANCEKVLEPIRRMLDGSNSVGKCDPLRLVDVVLGLDLEKDEDLAALVCPVIDNSDASSAELLEAMDHHGLIDRLVNGPYAAMAALGNLFSQKAAEYGADKERAQCSGGMLEETPFTLMPMFSALPAEAFTKLSKVIDTLGIFWLNPTATNAIGRMVIPDTDAFHMIPEVTVCPAHEDPATRCRMLQEAADPFLDVMFSNPQTMFAMQAASMAVAQYTGVNLNIATREFINDDLCALAGYRSVGDLRSHLRNLGLEKPIFDMVITQAGVRMAHPMYVDQTKQLLADAADPSKPSPPAEQLYMAQAFVDLAEAVQDTGFACIPLAYLNSPMFLRYRGHCNK